MNADLPLTVRWLIRRDIEAALELGAMTPWDDDDLRQHCKTRNGIAMVCEDENQSIVGWLAYSLHQSSIHIANIACDDWEFGAAYELMQRLLNKLGAETGYRRDLITVVVPESQDDVLCFFRNCGFVALVMRIAETTEYEMEYTLPQQNELCHIGGEPCRRSTGFPCMLPEGF